MEANLLRYLITHEGKPVSRKAMLEDVWGLHEDTDTRAIDNFIVRLRRYIEEDPAKPRHLLTVRGVGYGSWRSRTSSKSRLWAVGSGKCTRSMSLSGSSWSPEPKPSAVTIARRSAAARRRRRRRLNGASDAGAAVASCGRCGCDVGLRLELAPVRDDIGAIAVDLEPGERFVEDGAVQQPSLRARRRLDVEQLRLDAP